MVDDDNPAMHATSGSIHGGAATAATHAEKKEPAAACYSPSTSSEDMNDDGDFFQIDGPILTAQFSLDAQPPPTPPPDPRRIPSSVFERSKSKTNADWSVTSNESLFSINVGNTSFSKDYVFMYGKSGGDANDPLAPLPPLPRLGLQESSSVNGDGEMGAGSSSKVNAEKADGDADCMNSSSVGSDGGAPSFAFPILTGDERLSEHSKDNNNTGLSRQSTTQLSQLSEPPEEEEEDTLEAITKPPKVEQAPALAPTAQQPSSPAPPPPPPAAMAKWFPCCSCCPLCC